MFFFIQSDPLVGKFNTESCIPDDTITSSNLANIRFTTDGSVDRDGFRIETTGGTSRRHTNSQKKESVLYFSAAVDNTAVPVASGKRKLNRNKTIWQNSLIILVSP